MAYIGNSPAPPPATYTFIDGESFRKTLAQIADTFFDGNVPPVTWSQLRGISRKVYYYDAIPVQTTGEDDNTYYARTSSKRAELQAIEKQAGFHVKTGDVRRRGSRGNEQKMVDVQLAVDALLMASRGLFTACAIYTGDLDFRPLISALVDMGIDVTLYYPPGHANEDLLGAADTAVPVTLTNIRYLLNLDEATAQGLPSAYHDYQTNEQPPRDSLVVWDDDLFGRCFVVREDGRMKLVTQREPSNPKSHRLVLTASKAAHLRDHLATQYPTLNIPEFDE